MDINKVVASLHPLERAILPFLSQNIGLRQLIEKSGLNETEILRALQWLENKKIVKIKKEEKKVVNLGKNGKKYIIQGLPEKQLLGFLLYKEFTIDDLKKRSHLETDEVNVSLGLLKRRDAISINNKEVSITEYGKDLASKVTDEERFLKSLPKEFGGLNRDDKEVFRALLKRKGLIEVETEKSFNIEVEKLGKELSKEKIKRDFIETLTKEMFREELWKKKEFRRYDVKINVPKIYPGRRHFMNKAIQYAKKIWLEMGFKEMNGSIVNTSFWNFDSLFVPQDHPARDLQDTFFLNDKGKISDKRVKENVRLAHEKGLAGSRGWNYEWDEDEARKLVLRTHTTVLSAQTLAQIDLNNLPLKFFNVGRVYRNETMDWKHLFEFYQTEGIVIGSVNFKHLLGYLKEFFGKMGFEKVRFRPAYFPYTSMSTEVEVFYPEKQKWIELGGAGIFRPEVVVPLLGEDMPVLAWGLGLERIVMPYYNINDLREIYANDIKKLRTIKEWLK